ncbi:MAG: cytochrome C oxidase subunit IV family protein [Planctomycetota bacterium]|nr:cytochrome C oxidase subunit IV family protein [Planctomycetota bacterium]
MSEDHKHPNYILIWVVLLALTVLEVAVAFFPKWFPGMDSVIIITIGLLLGMAFVKAGLVAWYFMHLKFEEKNFVLIVSFPLVLACVLVILLLPDVAFG